MNIHFIGIGGIGVSALAKYYLSKGHKVTGSDLVSSEITEALKKMGAIIKIGSHRKENLPKDLELVIHSPAVPKNNPELKAAKKIGIECQSYPQALGELTKKHFTIAISGTHGKSTTTAMIGLLLTKAGFDPTVIVGTKLKEFGNSNCRVGKSRYLVIEADEHFASFLNYWPKIIVLTTLEADHLDYYQNLKNYLSAFKKFVSHLPKDGFLITNKDEKNIAKAKFSSIAKNVVFYSLLDKESQRIKKILKIPGEHNISNALAALAVARVLKIPEKISFEALSEYRGSWRRFETKKIKLEGKWSQPIILVSDYGHHPTEIRVTLKAAREKYPKRKIWCVYQPHQYQRTYYLFKDFVKVFKEAIRPAQGEPQVNKLIITDIYDVAGREEEKIKEKVSSKKLVEAVKKKLNKSILLHSNRLSAENVIYFPDFEKIMNYLKENLNGGEVVIIMGAGNIYNLTLELTKKEVAG